MNDKPGASHFRPDAGTLGTELAALGGLEVVDLSHNDLASPLPPALAGLQRLRVLDLSHTGAVGPLPEAWAASLPSLTALSVSANELTGTLPAAWAGMQLHSLDLSANRLRGSLPLQWGALQHLQSLSLAGNELEVGGWVGRSCRAGAVECRNQLVHACSAQRTCSSERLPPCMLKPATAAAAHAHTHPRRCCSRELHGICRAPSQPPGPEWRR